MLSFSKSRLQKRSLDFVQVFKELDSFVQRASGSLFRSLTLFPFRSGSDEHLLWANSPSKLFKLVPPLWNFQGKLICFPIILGTMDRYSNIGQSSLNKALVNKIYKHNIPLILKARIVLELIEIIIRRLDE